MKEALIVILAVVVGLFVVVEIGLRSLFGFGNPLVYIGDERIGYLLAPNQRTRRFGNRIEINEYSMRGSPIDKTPAPSGLRILLLGDSIANGGWWTDQTNTISAIMMRSLASSTHSNYQEVEVLNASANSWGPRNELAYLEKFSNFNAQIVVLLINTDDLFATPPTSLPVGRDRNYPDSKPPLALAEVWQRYIVKQQPIPEMKAVQNEAGDRVGINLEAIGKIQALTRQSNSQFLLVMTPLLREIGEPGPRDYEIKARQRLNDFTKTQQINYIDFLPIFNSTTNPQDLYHDSIHLNLQGNKFVSEVMERSLLERLGEIPLTQNY
ncbi:SGNH/GDSL hydrolase family protein [Nostoc sp. 'Peltigera membranacea cyanobiont' N6]|uniref:SGNH/GDSL hydrolase family protein n=1 Tax=Nostoc sp. 'Peltigera membranacea cyanobiont' N6 TaxID=1261031 RepID=UPI000CF354A9|nr:SGNH/GDSL hydrolase family protein [Nostoc sp. 'Peltigera membranacea cyanobiont' N6]AVH64931.1 GDSL family lipase [Nostoc sp. 'Peltigera membranacea cyanobiont' N6]